MLRTTITKCAVYRTPILVIAILSIFFIALNSTNKKNDLAYVNELIRTDYDTLILNINKTNTFNSKRISAQYLRTTYATVMESSYRHRAMKSDQEIQIQNECFLYKSNGHVLPDISNGTPKPNVYGKMNKNIFFHETSCSSDGVIKLRARQACAVESAARMNPEWNVFVLFSARVGFNNKTELPLIDQLSLYPNVYFRHENVESYTKDTPIGEWMAGGIIYNSSYFTAHLADTLRLISLWKYGGTYMDTDVIVRKSLNPLQSNYAGEESENYIANGVLNFDSFNGHKILNMCLRELMNKFDPVNWGSNGPALITRVLERVCHTNISIEMNPANCNGFKVLPQNEFYAIPYGGYELFFDETRLDEVLLRTANSTLVHFWNKLTANETVKVGSKVAYGVLANEYCPKIYSNCGKYF